MANTHFFKTHIEPFVRDWLKGQYDQEFRPQFLPLIGCEGLHEFDAVSADHKIVAGIKSSSAKTSGGRNPSGKIASVYQELYFLSNVKADTKLLVLTDEDFFGLMSHNCEGKLAGGIRLVYCPLTLELQALVKRVQSDASDEIDRGKKYYRAKATGH